MTTVDNERIKATLPDSGAGMRIDKALAVLFPEYSRSALQKWLRRGLILVDEEIPEQSDRARGGELVELVVPQEQATEWQPESMDISVVYEDEYLLVVNKPAGLVVHPGAGNYRGTLVNGLLDYDPTLSMLPRAGIVHRLDKDTTGLMVVARQEPTRLKLIEQLAMRQARRSYLAVVQGIPVSGGRVEEPVGRDHHDRRRMAISTRGKSAITHYRVEQRFRVHSLLRCSLETGRTHQIRVHMRHIGFPIVGDLVYGGRARLPSSPSDQLRAVLQGFSRQALHAAKLVIKHPHTGADTEWVAPVPDDMATLLHVLATDAEGGE